MHYVPVVFLVKHLSFILLIQIGPFNCVRAYDHLKEQFHTLKLNRIINSTTSTRAIGSIESIENDVDNDKH